jgi:hypothetical protein
LKKRRLTTLTRLLDYGGLAEIMFKTAGLTVLTLYILSLTGITLVDLTVSNLGILMMRAYAVGNSIHYIIYCSKPTATTRSRARHKEKD